jgi:hypothetical protein
MACYLIGRYLNRERQHTCIGNNNLELVVPVKIQVGWQLDEKTFWCLTQYLWMAYTDTLFMFLFLILLLHESIAHFSPFPKCIDWRPVLCHFFIVWHFSLCWLYVIVRIACDVWSADMSFQNYTFEVYILMSMNVHLLTVIGRYNTYSSVGPMSCRIQYCKTTIFVTFFSHFWLYTTYDFRLFLLSCK